jgi:HlyD family secretion protein
VRRFAAAISVLLASCSRSTPPTTYAATSPPAVASAPVVREVRLTGTVMAVHSSKILVPQIYGQGVALTLTHIIENGAQIKVGDRIASFDATDQIDKARDAKAKFDDLGHQVDQKSAQNNADAEKRAADLRQAEADLAKALIELKKGPLLSEIDRLKNEQKAAIAKTHVESLQKSNVQHDQADAAARRILELQRDRQKVALERIQSNMDKLEIKSTLAGMVAIQNTWRNNTNGHAQEGDQLWRGAPLLSIFDPSEMTVRCMVGEPDGSALKPGARATVYLDAYPDVRLPAHFDYASPVASAPPGSPIKTFTGFFKLDKTDPHLLPDLSAAVVLENSAAPGSSPAGKTK